jgi:hypothetical protein
LGEESWGRRSAKGGSMTEDTPTYSIHIIDHDRLTLGVFGDWADEAQALNWAYYYLGRYRCDAVRLFRCDTDGNATDLVTEIKPPAWIAERDQGPYGANAWARAEPPEFEVD